ncbi:30S ribosomal protein S15 [Coxiella endosymbiont of Amblyomma nuttalli]|uniref:30S ribosomal protein S15 n=1 Tax=Coxiella endosymbiont of Amblyomma nuttalli TaxID=2749996 RepID=UPI001BACFB56|nr:30S ribosomal protein S15 [Coxiella endosymbiont of Amblyomma nuttalli]QTS84073.1 30S ribosomal protein S15 [Coxiella endosymbiont of Amblyomma nuttalli]
MSLISTETKKIVKEYQLRQDDTGSPEVQIAILSAKIDKITEHLKSHTHDHHSRRGLLRMVSQRRRLLNYIRKNNKLERYRDLIKRLRLRS